MYNQITMLRTQNKVKTKTLYILGIVMLLIVFFSSGYIRFFVYHDYYTSYKTTCDTTNESCFSECTDDNCHEKNFYKYIKRDASQLYALCGADITNCDAAKRCGEGEQSCEVIYCKSKESCSTLDASNSNII